MEAMRKSWTDERLDDLRVEVDRRFNEVDRRFDRVETELQRINDRLDGMHRRMVHGFIAMTAAMMAGYAATIGLVVTQL
jgi:uncharacterized protein YPO0396